VTRGSRWLAWSGALIAGLACSDIAAPLRTDFYEWRRFVPSATGTGIDTLSFHWPQSALPVRVWVEDTVGLPANFERAIGIWKSVYLYHEFDARLVSDSTTADILVRGIPAPGLLLDRVELRSALRPECKGATDLDVSDDDTELRPPIRIYINPLLSLDDPDLLDCLALTSIHELGHALGIFEHSPNATDIMFANPLVPLPSAFDRGTAEVLYHVPSTLRLVRP
jgi:hypothetical protein